MALKQEFEHKNVIYKEAYQRISQHTVFAANRNTEMYTLHLNVDTYSDDTMEEFLEGKVYGVSLPEDKLNFKEYYYELKCMDEFFSAEDVFEGKQLDQKE